MMTSNEQKRAKSNRRTKNTKDNLMSPSSLPTNTIPMGNFN